jgi:uncharacterized membrane protein YhaH (DUF805 family)
MRSLKNNLWWVAAVLFVVAIGFMVFATIFGDRPTEGRRGDTMVNILWWVMGVAVAIFVIRTGVKLGMRDANKERNRPK